ncbi:MAG TPA: cyclic nucleotide-binding domain-containing protein [Bacteroidota bacterium]|nr:cyclic nucleotide-binding domain-containing protein [Bacteroidota bacterium]
MTTLQSDILPIQKLKNALPFKKNEATIEEVLAKISVFESLKPKELRQVAAIVHRRRYKSGEYIVRQNDPGLGMYVIESGEVSVMLEENGSTKQLASLCEGEFFGEIALLDESPRSATVIAQTESALIGFFRPDLFDIIEKSPATGLKIVLRLAEMLGERLRNSNLEISKLRAQLNTIQH